MREANDSSMTSWQMELRALTRALSSSYLFGIPLLFTMEMWWIGLYVERWKLMSFLLLAFLANLGLNYFAGFEQQRGFDRAFTQALEAVAIGIVASTMVLLVLNRINLTDPLDSIVGMIVVQAIPLGIGASVGNAIFGRREGGRAGDEDETGISPLMATLNDAGATAIGGVFVAFSVAPTEEIPMLAASMDFPHLLALIALTLAIAYGVVFASGFDIGAQGHGLFQHPITETVLAYVVSLGVAGISLYLFDQIELGEPLGSTLTQVLVLGLPASVGGAAGRLAV